MNFANDPPERRSGRVLRFGPVMLGVAGLAILLSVIWREHQLARWRTQTPGPRAAPRILAPRFNLADHHRHVVKFERFLGRQRVLVVFFDAELGPLRDPRLTLILDCFPILHRMMVEVIGISSATPYANLAAEEERGEMFPFPLLTDIDLKSPISNPVHRLWGRYDERRDQTLTGLFLVARDGTVPIGPDGLPDPVADEQLALDRLCRGEWPE